MQVKPVCVSTFHFTYNNRRRGKRCCCVHMNCKFEDIISLENLLKAWIEFLSGKKYKKDVANFSLHLMDNLRVLHDELSTKTYKHGGYKAFKISDPKPRDIHKATVRDRLVHHAIHRVLYPYFDKKFIFDSYSSRLVKGTHKAVNRFRDYFYKVSKNNTRTCWVLKGDVRKFFASIDHNKLISILQRHLTDKNILNLLKEVINSFYGIINGIGLPLGNLTSQLFVNIYLNEFDQFIKHDLKVKFYVRFADDFVILSKDKNYLIDTLNVITDYLVKELKLTLHPNKVSIETFSSGIDFLGLVNFPNYRVLRTKTKRRMFSKLEKRHESYKTGMIPGESLNQSLQSYLGILKHCNGHDLTRKIKKFAVKLDKSNNGLYKVVVICYILMSFCRIRNNLEAKNVE